MTIVKLTIDGFGVLNGVNLERLSGGLNVFQGPNGSGKTTILHFSRGILGGFEDAQRLQLLPQTDGGMSGGSLTIQDAGRTFDIIRRFRPDHADTLAIRYAPGNASEADRLRTQIESIDRDVLRSVFLVSRHEAAAIDALVRLAQRDGIPLEDRRRSAGWLTDRIANAGRERDGLCTSDSRQGAIPRLEQHCSELVHRISAAQSQQRERWERWSHAMRQSSEEISRVTAVRDWLHAELQRAQAELIEVQDRLWSSREVVVQDIPDDPQVEAVDWIDDVREIDEQIARARDVLKDLAASRASLSRIRADLTGGDVPAARITHQRQRELLFRIEQEADRLAAFTDHVRSAVRDKNCLCDRVPPALASAVETIRQRTWRLCQEISQQESQDALRVVEKERSNLDACEQQLTAEIQRLHQKRDQLLHAPGRTTAERLRFLPVHGTDGCRCDGHPSAARPVEAPQIPAPRVRVLHEMNARPGDADRQVRLRAEIDSLRNRWWQTTAQLRDLRARRRKLQLEEEQLVQDTSVQRLRYEHAGAEQQLADAREQWHSLSFLETVLSRTRDKLEVSTPPRVLQEASQYLSRITDGRYREFRFHAGPDELTVVDDAGNEVRMFALSRGTLDQAALAFRLALWTEYQNRGVRFPLVLDDVLADSDEDRLQAIVRVLVDFAQQGNQVFYFTCQDRLVHLFQAAGIEVRDLPDRFGSILPPTIPEEQPASGIGFAWDAETEQTEHEAPERMRRVQPDQPYWLQATSPVGDVPSLGIQMARRLGTLGVRDISDLMELNPTEFESALASLQISSSMLRRWQAEARLLCCVPDLTGRDAQLLVLCGILSPAELEIASPENLLQHARLVQTRDVHRVALPWLGEQARALDVKRVSAWIRRGRAARSFPESQSSLSSQVREASSHTTRRHLRQLREDGKHSSTGFDGAGISSVVPEPHSFGAPVDGGLGFRGRPRTRPSDEDWKFYLHMDSPVVDAPSIGPKTAARLKEFGILTVSDLIHRNAHEIAEKLDLRRVSAETVRNWQQQAELVCRIPKLRGHDAQVLVACEITSPEALAHYAPEVLFQIVAPFAESPAGRRILRSGSAPDLAEVSDWIEYAQNSRALSVA